jgi:glycosyltransferase involved in cell wall biosynthesis
LDPELLAPGDRRRFPRYARERGIAFDLVQHCADHELVVLSQAADLTHWSRAPRGTKLVYELIDAYLDAEPTTAKARLRGLAKYLLGRSERLEWSFRNSIRRMCERADVVVCSSPEQRETILSYNHNVQLILDYHGDEVSSHKIEHVDKQEIHLLWEGKADNLATFVTIADVLQRLSRHRSLVLHLVTDLSFKPANGPIPALPTQWLLNRILPGVRVVLSDWDKTVLGALAEVCDLGIIPMFLDRGFYRNKPENKLLLLWRLGLPVITAATPAYKRTMIEAGLDMYCETAADWEDRLVYYMANAAARSEAAQKGLSYTETRHSDAVRTKAWDALFESLGVGNLRDDAGLRTSAAGRASKPL